MTNFILKKRKNDFLKKLKLNKYRLNRHNKVIIYFQGYTYPELPQTFQTRVEINYITEKRSATTQWFYDYNKRKGAIHIKENNFIYQLIFNYKTDELFSVDASSNEPTSVIEPSEGRPLYPSDCTTSKISDYNIRTLYKFGSLFYNGDLLPLRPIEIFQFYHQVTSFILLFESQLN